MSYPVEQDVVDSVPMSIGHQCESNLVWAGHSQPTGGSRSFRCNSDGPQNLTSRQTRRARWVVRILAALVVLCLVLGAWVWSEILHVLP